MARISRVVASGYPHHVTQRGVRSIPIFQTDSDRRAYLDFMAEELDRFGTEVLAWCLMTNHTHLIVVPKDSKVLARAIGEAHGRYAYPYEFLEATMRRFGSRQDESEQMIERLTGRDLAVRKAGRPLKRAS